GWLAVEAETETHRGSARARPHDQMDVAGVEAKDDAPARRVELGALVADRPVSGERPSIAIQALGRRVDVPLVSLRAARRGEAFRPRRAEVGLGRFQVGPIGGGFDPAPLHRHQLTIAAAVPCLLEEVLDGALRFLVPALAELIVTDLPVRIDDVERRP